MVSPPEELVSLARTVADWADRFAAIESVVIFGSRVRGDYGPESDLDVWIEDRGDVPAEAVDAWCDELAGEGLATLKAATGLFVHWPRDDESVRMVVRYHRDRAILTDRKVARVPTPRWKP